jgi:hypothetical protein
VFLHAGARLAYDTRQYMVFGAVKDASAENAEVQCCSMLLLHQLRAVGNVCDVAACVLVPLLRVVVRVPVAGLHVRHTRACRCIWRVTQPIYGQSPAQLSKMWALEWPSCTCLQPSARRHDSSKRDTLVSMAVLRVDI